MWWNLSAWKWPYSVIAITKTRWYECSACFYPVEEGYIFYPHPRWVTWFLRTTLITLTHVTWVHVLSRFIAFAWMPVEMYGFLLYLDHCTCVSWPIVPDWRYDLKIWRAFRYKPFKNGLKVNSDMVATFYYNDKGFKEADKKFLHLK